METPGLAKEGDVKFWVCGWFLTDEIWKSEIGGHFGPKRLKKI